MTDAGSGPATRWFDDVREGDVAAPVEYGPLTIMHLVRWCGATENWHRIHYDDHFCREHEDLPGPVVNGTWKQQVLAQFLKEWAGSSGWLRRIRVSFRGMDVAGASLVLEGRVVGRTDHGDFGAVHWEVNSTNDAGTVTTSAAATVLLPKRAGPPLPYPLPPEDDDLRDAPASGSCPPHLQRYLGATSGELVAPDRVEAGSVRRFMQAIMADDSDYYAPTRSGRFGAPVAPPLYPLHAFHPEAGGPDPLARARGNPDFDGAGQTPWSSFGLPELEGVPRRILNAGNDIELSSYAPHGSGIAVMSTYDDIYVKEGREGPLLFVATMSRYRIAETDQPLLRARQLIILR